MGLIDIETMNQIRYALDKIDPSIIIIGEGWEMGEALEFKDKACLWNSKYLPRIGQFNDDFRDGIRGDNFNAESIGYIGGDYSKKLSVLRGIVGGIEYSDHIKHLDGVEPNQTVNYVEVHDNHTLYDKLKLSVKDKCIKERHLLGTAIAILSQGITLIHSGQEIMRTKDFEHNTYNMGDEINKFDWHRKKEYLDVFKYVKALIQIKKEHPSFRLKHNHEIKDHLRILETRESVIAYTIKNPKDSWHKILVIHNVSTEKKLVNLKENRTWHLVIHGKNIDLDGKKKISGETITIEKLSTIIAYSLE
jgi:pullulanase